MSYASCRQAFSGSYAVCYGRRRTNSIFSKTVALLMLVGLLFVAGSAKAKPAFTLAAANSIPEKGQSYTVALPNGQDIEMQWCPKGSFMMGSPEDEIGRFDDETQHQVTLTNGFWLSQYEVTQAQYLAVSGRNPSRFMGEDKPAEMVSWEEAMEFCQKLNELLSSKLPAGYEYSLPSEAQWEYACRAGTSSALNDGQELTSDTGNCPNINQLGWNIKNSDDHTHPVGQKLPNAWGFYDMHGNVIEWCRDRWNSYSGAATDPTGPNIGDYRVGRGGSWVDYGTYCRSAFRFNFPPDLRGSNIGFRLSLVMASSHFQPDKG